MKNNIFNLLKVFLFFLIITGGGNTITLSAQQSGKRIITGQVIDDENQEKFYANTRIKAESYIKI